ncbi:hypothetical protein GCM10025768_26270 [Microbacterium pseudoresistens]|uniref:Uncharacterized protein n=1 Tax=Microbacterium pseudoresistens TaxID=640634 RepID=A0A7Y9JLV8_9MICO|nr:hypothetical protein [Microbacterium pseudoresistens]NYD53740.1 hypothetical protein [Microbacterium pseudoresistens]
MIVSFIIFLVLFLGGIWLMGFAQALTTVPALVFVAGLVLVCLSLAWIMRERGGATKRTKSWE